MLRRWRVGDQYSSTYIYTCGRPGRSKGKDGRVSDKLVDEWVLGLPGPKTAVVSLLGRKPDGVSEFSFYPFWGGDDTVAEHQARPSFQEWLAQNHPDLDIALRQHPTYDFQKIPTSTLEAISTDINELIYEERTVVVVDSGGVTRTEMVCTFMHATEDS